MTIGVTGKYCAGKDTLSRILAEYGFHVIDVDKIGHQVLSDMKEHVVESFGHKILTGSGEVDRKKLGDIVFRNTGSRRKLEAIVHPEMAERVRTAISAKTVINAALLFKMELDRFCDSIICVKAPLPVRLIRALKRDKLSPGDALRRHLSQRGICPKFPIRDVDIYSIRNLNDRNSLKRKVDDYFLKEGINGVR